jgi:hypothetical protein
MEILKANLFNKTLNRANVQPCLGLIKSQVINTEGEIMYNFIHWQLVEEYGEPQDPPILPQCLQVNILNTLYKQVLFFDMLHVKFKKWHRRNKL